MTGLLEMRETKPGTVGEGDHLHRLQPMYARGREVDLWGSEKGEGLRTEEY
jgi:hypothetical protein